MKLEKIKFWETINNSYSKQSLLRVDIELFKTNFKNMFNKTDDKESEEHNKNIVSDFLKNTYYKTKYEINTSGRKDLVIHKGNSNKTPVAVMIETKKSSNKSEMISFEKPNVKSLHEIIHYYLQERLIKNNEEIKHVIITNIYDWFIFDAGEFEKYFYQNNDFREKYQNWKAGKLAGKTTNWFYTEIAKKFVENNIENLKCAHINLRDYEKIVNNPEDENEKKLINLYKIFSPEHLLKLFFSNDYNKIDTGFYNELLYILGLEEKMKAGINIITRVREKKRNFASLLENTINVINIREKFKNVKRVDLLGIKDDEKLFSIALELSITWLNRILFLKLLEGQLVKFNNGNKNFAFLNLRKIKNFKEIDELFFEVLAEKPKNRTNSVNKKFGNLPYLNSSLFEITELEKKTILISSLKDRLNLPTANFTVLKDENGRKKITKLNTLEYLFEFLNAYNFSSETNAEIQDDRKTIINAAVLGLIFEKINGYKDGSFYTPSFITSYMSRENIRKIILKKFAENYKRQFKNFEDLKDFIDYPDPEERKKANEIINDLRICDPAVGSGHFLVSVLNELVAIKSELKILNNPDNRRIKGIKIKSVNDELEITDEETGEPFKYYLNKKGNPLSEVQNVQKAVFNEKRNLIENCIYGVDINPKSVLICRLRLWIELLKSTYYTEETNFQFIETLPNIDINIKTGNSLISKFDIELNIFEKKAVNNLIIQYKLISDEYRKTSNYYEKSTFREQMERLKSELEKYAVPKNEYYKKYLKSLNEFKKYFAIQSLNKDVQNQIIKLSKELTELEKKYKEIYYNAYSNSMEWSIEFPSILSNEGEFVGFDFIIGNPPYISISKQQILREVKSHYQIYKQTGDVYMLFIERGLRILRKGGTLTYITSNKWMRSAYGESLRKFLSENVTVKKLIDFDGLKVFPKATVDTNIIEILKKKNENKTAEAVRLDKTFDLEEDSISDYFNENKVMLSGLSTSGWSLMSEKEKQIRKKVEKLGKPIKKWNIKIYRGVTTGLNEAFIISGDKRKEILDNCQTKEEKQKTDKMFKPALRGRNIKKYYHQKPDLWLIKIPKGFTKQIGKLNDITEKTAWNVFKNNYSALASYFIQFKNKAKKRYDKGDFWWELRACLYYNAFEKNKLMWTDIATEPLFTVIPKTYYFTNTAFMMFGNKLKYLLGVLNSKLVKWYFPLIASSLGAEGQRFIKIFVEKIPIPEITEKNQKTVRKIERLVNKILSLKKQNPKTNTTREQTKIDNLVYELYELTKAEIKLIEK